jgi:hypothetical protein
MLTLTFYKGLAKKRMELKENMGLKRKKWGYHSKFLRKITKNQRFFESPKMQSIFDRFGKNKYSTRLHTRS